jgi:hypothetical protein
MNPENWEKRDFGFHQPAKMEISLFCIYNVNQSNYKVYTKRLHWIYNRKTVVSTKKTYDHGNLALVSQQPSTSPHVKASRSILQRPAGSGISAMGNEGFAYNTSLDSAAASR